MRVGLVIVETSLLNTSEGRLIGRDLQSSTKNLVENNLLKSLLSTTVDINRFMGVQNFFFLEEFKSNPLGLTPESNPQFRYCITVGRRTTRTTKNPK